MTERPKRAPLRAALAMLSLVGAAAPPPEMLGAPKTVIQDTRWRRKPPHPDKLIRVRFSSWDRLKALGWTLDGRKDRINPKRSRRRRWAAKFEEITGRRLTGRQYKRLLRGKLPPQKLPVIT